MDAIIPTPHLHEFMLRIDRMAPGCDLSGLFDLTSAAATLQAHLDLIAVLNPSPVAVRKQVSQSVMEFRKETRRLRSCLMRQWLSRTLSPASTRAGVRDPRGEAGLMPLCSADDLGTRVEYALEVSDDSHPKEANDAYVRALDHSRVLLSLVIPSALSWYDATIGR